MPSPFGWCSDGHHENCRRSYKSLTTGKVRYCACTLPRCPCSKNPREDSEK